LGTTKQFLDDLGLRALDELPALGAAEITEALQSLALEGQALGAAPKSGDLLDQATHELALGEEHAATDEHTATDEHAATDEPAAADESSEPQDAHSADPGAQAQPILNSELNTSGDAPAQTSTFPPESK
jgi:segregation and condensation protein B